MKFYAVKKGRTTGILSSWEECKKSIHQFPCAVYKSFSTRKEAENFLQDKQDNLLENSSTNNNFENPLGKIENNELIAYIDGSYNNEKKIYSSGGIIFYKGKNQTIEKKQYFENTNYNETFKGYEKEFCFFGNKEDLVNMRNVTGEILASIFVMTYGKNNNFSKITIYYDYTGIENWAKGFWKTNNKLTKHYKNFYDTKIKPFIKVTFVKVKSHTNNKYNEYADKMAKLGIDKAIELI